jgi:AAA family ATP:ADP antiporter
MRRILALVLLGTMTVTVADYVFKSVVAREVAPQELASFFARYYAALNGLSLVVQFVVTPRLLRSAGVHRVLQVTPLCLLAASIGFAATGGLFAVLLLRGADGALRHSVNRVGNEMLYLPLRTEVRRRFRAFVEAVGLRAGQALASLLILFALVLDLGPVALSLAAVALAAAWLATTGRLRDLYVGRFQRDLGKQPFETPSFIDDLDTRGLSALYRALGSDDDAEVVAALEMLAACDERELLPKDLLTHRSPRIVLWALEHLPGPRADVRRATEQLLTHSDASVRAAALRHRIVSGAEAELLERFREDPSAAVRATALVGSIRSGALDANAARRELRTVVSAPEREGRSALGRTLFLLPPEHRVRLATELLEREERGLAVLVVKSIAVEPDPRFVPVLIPLLARQSARGEARRALVAIGPAALEAASAALSDAATPPELRRHLPRTISHFSGPAAVAILEAALAQERDDAVAFKILRGLGSLRRDAPDLPVNRALLEGAARTMIRRALVGACFGYGLGAARRRLSHVNTTSAELLAATLADDAERAFERLFRLMHVLEPTRSMELIFTAVRSGDPDIRARGRELFEHLAPQELRREVTPLLDDAPLSERLSEVVLARVAPQCALALALGRLCDGEPRRGPGSEPPILAAFARALAALCRHESSVLSAVACHYRAELGLGSATEPELESLRKLGTRPLPEGVDQALAARTSRSRERPHAR